MGLFSVAKLFGVTIRESANDGSDFTNPDADYRRLFLGEDGLLHVKDSSGTVSDPFTGGGSVATDAIWDAAGDSVYGTGANTASRLAIGAAGLGYHVNSGATAPEWSADRPPCYETFLAAGDVTMVNADTWYSTTELALTPPAGDYLVLGHASCVSASSAATQLRAKLSTGGSLSTNVLTGDTQFGNEALTYNPASNAGGMVLLSVHGRVTVNGSTAIRLSCSDIRGSSDGKISETLLNQGTANKATSLVAMRITSV